jgi:transglutaminase-like putative cysteine protease
MVGRLGSANAGSTHAWAEVHVPGAGWITFDPTNRSGGGPRQIAPGIPSVIGAAI